jgi:hypothetical protein
VSGHSGQCKSSGGSKLQMVARTGRQHNQTWKDRRMQHAAPPVGARLGSRKRGATRSSTSTPSTATRQRPTCLNRQHPMSLRVLPLPLPVPVARSSGKSHYQCSHCLPRSGHRAIIVTAFLG